MFIHVMIIGGVHSYLHTVLLVCRSFFAFLDHGAISVLCLYVAMLPREQGLLNSTNRQIQWKVAVTEALPVTSC